MRKASKPQHPVGILRSIIGLGQQELATMVGRSPRTIQAVEINRLPLSSELAQRISLETGVALSWLLAGDVNAPVLAQSVTLVPYTKAFFEETRARLIAGDDPDQWEELRRTLIGWFGEPKTAQEYASLQRFMHLIDPRTSFQSRFDVHLSRILSAVCAASKVGRTELADYKLRQFASTMEQEFGQLVDEDFINKSEAILTSCLANMASVRSRIRGKKKVFCSPFVDKKNWLKNSGEDYLDPWWEIQADPKVPEAVVKQEEFVATMTPIAKRLNHKLEQLDKIRTALNNR